MDCHPVTPIFNESKKFTIFWPNFRCEHLMVRNEQLRQQLEESHRTNAALASDVHKLTDEWQHLRDEIVHKEDELKEEEQVKTIFLALMKNV